MGSKKRIRVTEAQRDTLHAMKRPGEDYSDVVSRLIDMAGVDVDQRRIISGESTD
jgi:predicted CopG family antitoxin